MASVQSIIDRVKSITKDEDLVRWTSDEIVKWINDAQDQIASIHPRASTTYIPLTLAQGSRQDLRTISPTTRWIRLYELVVNITGSSGSPKPDGTTIRMIPRSVLDTAFRTWRTASPTAAEVKECAIDERDPYTFDVYPPVAAGTRVLALAAVMPPAVTAGSQFGLPDRYDIPALDYVLYRCFSKDANDPTYTARAQAHLQSFQLAMGVETADAGAT